MFRLDLKVMENVWIEQRLKMLDNSLEIVKKEEIRQEEEEESGCARCRIYKKKENHQSDLFRKIHQFHREHNYSLTSSSPGLFFFLFLIFLYLLIF